jgi:NADPH-dependent curcumin reductase CurA
MGDTNEGIVLRSRPHGLLRHEDVELIDLPMPEVPENGCVVEVEWLGIDATVRSWLDEGQGYLPAVEIGEVVRCSGSGTVIETTSDRFPIGECATALTGWQRYVALPDDLLVTPVGKASEVDQPAFQAVYGATGVTAYLGMVEVGEAKEGETVVVSAAAGATGSTVGQIAKAKGCKVIGLVGSPEKAQVIRDLGFDAAIDYRATPDIAAEIAVAAPEGVDVYFDNVGGEMLEAILPLMRLHGRVPVCGMIGQYNDADHPYGVKTLWQLVVNRIRMQGFITYDHPEVLEQAQAELDAWVGEGRLKPLANVRDGFEKLPEAFIDLMSGRTIGKTLVRI